MSRGVFGGTGNSFRRLYSWFVKNVAVNKQLEGKTKWVRMNSIILILATEI